MAEISQTWVRSPDWLFTEYLLHWVAAQKESVRQELDRNGASTSSCGEGGVVWQVTPNLFHINPNQASSPWETSPECQGGPESDPNLGEWWECLCLLSGHFPTAWERLQIGGLAISRAGGEGIRAGPPCTRLPRLPTPGGPRSSVQSSSSLLTLLRHATSESWDKSVGRWGKVKILKHDCTVQSRLLSVEWFPKTSFLETDIVRC